MAENFADLVAKTSVDNRELESGMRRGEQIVKGSASKMNASMAGMGGGADALRMKNEGLTRSLTAAGAAGSLAGSQIGGVVSQAAGLTGAMTALGVSLGPVSLALAAIAAIGFSVWTSFRKGEEATDDWRESLRPMTERLSDLRMELRMLKGHADEYDKAMNKAYQTSRKFESVRAREAYMGDAERAFAIQQQITTEKKEQADLAKGIAAFEQAIADTASRDIANAAAETAKRKAEELKLEAQLLAATKQRQAVMESLAKSQEDRNRSLARSLAVSVGIAKPSDFATNAQEKALLEIQEMLGGNAAATGGTAAPGGGFTIGGRPASEFRFGGPGGGPEFIGQQREQAKTTEAIKVQTGVIEELLEFIKINPGILGKTTTQGLSFGAPGP